MFGFSATAAAAVAHKNRFTVVKHASMARSSLLMLFLSFAHRVNLQTVVVVSPAGLASKDRHRLAFGCS
jgi:hypothetical protein